MQVRRLTNLSGRNIIYVEHIYGTQAAAATATINIQFVLLTERRFCGRVRDHNWKGPLMHPDGSASGESDLPRDEHKHHRATSI